MQTTLLGMTYEIEIEPGEQFSLPQWLIDSISPGRWTLVIRPVTTPVLPEPVRNHQAFLNSYVPEDDGLYDDCTAG